MNNSRSNFADIFSEMAISLAKRSESNDLKVGCVIINKSLQILGIGYNAWAKGYQPSPQGKENKRAKVGKDTIYNFKINEKKISLIGKTGQKTKMVSENDSHMLHAEMNAILHANCNLSKENIMIFTTHIPCEQCMKSLAQLNTEAVFYMSDHGKYPRTWITAMEKNIPMIYLPAIQDIGVDIKQVTTLWSEDRGPNILPFPLIEDQNEYSNQNFVIDETFTYSQLMIENQEFQPFLDTFHVKPRNKESEVTTNQNFKTKKISGDEQLSQK